MTAEEIYLTLTVADQLCGVPVLAMRDVLGAQAITRIPLAPPEVAGSLNLRGRIVTAIDLRCRLGLPPRAEGQRGAMSVVVERDGELYSLLADQVGEVLPLPRADARANPATLDGVWRDVSRGVHRLGETAADRPRCRADPGDRLSHVRRPAPQGIRKGERTMTGESPATCLVVDDSRTVRKAARRILEKLGFTVAEAEDGAEALVACRGRMPQAVLLDWNMPVMDGIDFLRAARAGIRPGPAHRGALHDRGGDGRGSSRRSRRGAQEYVMKPFDEAHPARQIHPGRPAAGRGRMTSPPLPRPAPPRRRTPVRVMLCDDSATVRAALTRVLEADPGIRVVARVGDGQQAVAAFAALPAGRAAAGGAARPRDAGDGRHDRAAAAAAAAAAAGGDRRQRADPEGRRADHGGTAGRRGRLRAQAAAPPAAAWPTRPSAPSWWPR